MLNRYFILTLLMGFAFTAFAQPGDIPNAQAGKCYAKCLVHDKFETVTEQVIVKPAYGTTTVLPTEFEEVTGYYVAKESYIRLVYVPAIFETIEEKIQLAPPGRKTNPAAFEAIEEKVLIRPATKYYEVTDAVFEEAQAAVEIEPTYMNLEVLPQRYEPLTERIEVREATTKWIRKNAGRGCLSADPEDCFVWCMVEVPAQFQTIHKQVAVGCDGNGSTDCERYMPVAAVTTPMPILKLSKPAQARELVNPAKYKTVTKWVLKPTATAPAATGEGEMLTVFRKVLVKPARLREEVVPAEYKTIKRKRIKKEAVLQAETQPAEYLTITKRVLVRKGGFSVWREIICGEKMTGYTVRQIQGALQALGYYKGTIDGSMNARTKASIQQFQEERSLPADGNVDFETLKALGIN